MTWGEDKPVADYAAFYATNANTANVPSPGNVILALK